MKASSSYSEIMVSFSSLSAALSGNLGSFLLILLKNIASIVSTNIVHVNEWKARVKWSTITSKVKVGSLRFKACFKL
jgi:hypothetical protein